MAQEFRVLVSRTLFILSASIILTACGSSDNSVDTPAPAATAPTTFTLSGTAAGGAPFAGAKITIIDSAGTVFGGTVTDVTGTDGSYTITLPLTAKPPFVIQAARTDQTLVSVVAEAKDGTANITPVTNLIASRLSSSGDPAQLAAEIQKDPSLVDATKLTAAVAEVVTLIKPLMDAVGDTTDPLSGNIQAAVSAGTGADKMLDSLSINITPSSASTVNIEVSVKQMQADGTQPVVVAFTGGTGASAPPAALPTVTATDLVPNGNAALIADFLQRMTACYALAQADRMATGGKTAADIKASACKDVFLGNDPTAYLSNGAVVSSSGAFSGIFGTKTGTIFDNGSYEFTRGNGDLVIAYRSTDSSGNVANSTLAVRTDTDKKLRAIGNQYKYDGGVNAYQQLRTFINQTGADYYSTGYNLTVNNSVDASGNSIFAKVVVTSPRGDTLTLQPSAGSSYLPLVKNTGVSGTNFVRIRSVYADEANSAKDPALADTGLFFVNSPLTDSQIAALGAQSTWRFDYYLAANTSTTPDATQYYKTRSRAMTIAELQAQPLANVAAADVTTFQAASATTLYVPADPLKQVQFGWDVPTGALAPTSIQVYGNWFDTSKKPQTKTAFNDKVTVASSARSGVISCSAGAGDSHCSGSNYVTSDRFTGVHVWAQDPTGRDFAHFYAFYTITP